MNTLIQDVRFAIRMFLKNPAFTGIALLTLALGVGANAAIFSVLDAVLLRPLPYPDPGQLTLIWQNDSTSGLGRTTVSPPNFMVSGQIPFEIV